MNFHAKWLQRFGRTSPFGVATVFVMVFFCFRGVAQSGAGSIQGTVSDATGAVLSF